MNTTIYDKNRTMRLIGFQCYEITDDVITEIEDIIKARAPHIDTAPYSVKDAMVRMSIDLFLLGYIHGKRDERAKKSKKTTRTA